MYGPQGSVDGQPPAAAGGAGTGKREFGEGRTGVLLAIAVVAGLVGFVVVLVVFPALLAWLVALGLLALILAAVLAILLSVGLAMLTLGAGAYYLMKRHEVQGPEVGYTLDMVEKPKREGP